VAGRQQHSRLRRSTEPRAYRNGNGPCQLIEGLPGSSPSHGNHKDPPRWFRRLCAHICEGPDGTQDGPRRLPLPRASIDQLE
jgi:hypothetical protein